MTIFSTSNFDFISEFRKLDRKMPKCGSWTRGSENCDYGDILTISKNCYMCFNCGNCEDCLYCKNCKKLKDCLDCSFCEECTLCRECIDCDGCYDCEFCQDCSNSNGLKYCYDTHGSTDCIGCCGLRNQKYHIFNKKYSKEEFFERVAKLSESEILENFDKLQKEVPRKFAHQLDTENCSGDYLYHSKNCHNCFDTRASEDSMHITQANLDMGTKDCVDCGPTPTGIELCYDCCFCHYLMNCNHIYFCGRLSDCRWCTNCFDGKNLFGCNYLKNKEEGFYILNEKVEKDFYREKTEEIEAELAEKGVFSLWDLFYKKLDEDGKREGCRECGAKFEIAEKEKAFYQKKNLPLPVDCSSCREKKRDSLRSMAEVFKRKCDACGKVLISTFGADSVYRVVCLDCYWQEIG